VSKREVAEKILDRVIALIKKPENKKTPEKQKQLKAK
jgi:hypothetical protein